MKQYIKFTAIIEINSDNEVKLLENEIRVVINSPAISHYCVRAKVIKPEVLKDAINE